MFAPATRGQWRRNHPAVSPVHARAAAIAADLGIDVLSLTPAFAAHYDASDDRVDYRPLDWHWTPIGHTLVTGALTTHLADRCAAP
jgi:hypothetical protein